MTLEPDRLSSLLNPARVAVVGASARGGPGAKLLSTIRDFGFAGEVWPISGGGASVHSGTVGFPGQPNGEACCGYAISQNVRCTE